MQSCKAVIKSIAHLTIQEMVKTVHQSPMGVKGRPGLKLLVVS